MPEAEVTIDGVDTHVSSALVEQEASSLPKEIIAMEDLWRLVKPGYETFTSLEGGEGEVVLSREQLERVLGVQSFKDMLAIEALAKEPIDPGDGWKRDVTGKNESQLRMHVTSSGNSQGDVMVSYEHADGLVQFDSAIEGGPARKVRLDLIGEKDYRLQIVRQVGDREITVRGGSQRSADGRTLLKVTEATTKLNPRPQKSAQI